MYFKKDIMMQYKMELIIRPIYDVRSVSNLSKKKNLYEHTQIKSLINLNSNKKWYYSGNKLAVPSKRITDMFWSKICGGKGVGMRLI